MLLCWRNHEKLHANCAAVFERASLKDPGVQSSKQKNTRKNMKFWPLNSFGL